MLAILSIIMLFLGGLIACYGLIVSQAPDIKKKFDVIVPYQGVIGVILIILGLIDLFNVGAIFNMFSYNLFFGLISLLLLLSKLILGFILAYGLITRYLTQGHDGATESVKKTYQTLVVVQVPFGILAILLALIGVVFMLL